MSIPKQQEEAKATRLSQVNEMKNNLYGATEELRDLVSALKDRLLSVTKNEEYKEEEKEVSPKPLATLVPLAYEMQEIFHNLSTTNREIAKILDILEL